MDRLAAAMFILVLDDGAALARGTIEGSSGSHGFCFPLGEKTLISGPDFESTQVEILFN
jgi:hypothetical protein